MKNFLELRLIHAIILVCIPISYNSYAQTSDESGYGILMYRAGLKTSDLYNLSLHNQGFGTSRSAAMGGAFTSLGGDLASISINPAGLGMYRSSEIGVSAGMLIAETSNSASSKTVSKKYPILNNVSAAFNVYQGGGNLTSFTLGIGYNRLADFNYNTVVPAASGNTTIVDVFSYQMRGINPSEFTGNPHNLQKDKWGALMARRVGLIEPYKSTDGTYLYDTYAVAANANISRYAEISSEGGIGEYSIAGGMNFRNRVYFGFAVGLQDIYMKQNYWYRESYDNNGSAVKPAGSMEYSQTEKITGTGVNFKAGLIIRPSKNLRIGVAVHSPTLINYRKHYYAGMDVNYQNKSSNSTGVEVSFLSDDFITPTRLMAGVSYALGNWAIISADFERTWYNGIRLVTRDTSQEVKDWYTSEIKNHFRVTNTVRVGAEIKPLPRVALRAGYADYGSMLKNSNLIYDDPVGYRTRNISGGIGFRSRGNFSIDFTYVYMETKYTEYRLFSYRGYDNAGNSVDINSGNTDHKLVRHNAIISLSLRF